MSPLVRCAKAARGALRSAHDLLDEDPANRHVEAVGDIAQRFLDAVRWWADHEQARLRERIASGSRGPREDVASGRAAP